MLLASANKLWFGVLFTTILKQIKLIYSQYRHVPLKKVTGSWKPAHFFAILLHLFASLGFHAFTTKVNGILSSIVSNAGCVITK